ncbi:hypothetical protein PR202_gb00504 [Eleusine coracana subsp. coracana]|uniref:Carbonic anhydrase n=1 Tax=Eleusine coracana subsp. coracana TaxID=191504 RepID=A0AAV5DTK0_ELECO|nr:hypothetical protein PR202_gb00504 [Eleusine coracana subsp. coracana]
MPAMAMSSRAAVVLLVLAGSVALSYGSGPKLFGYTAGSLNGPENWAKLSPENKICGDGKRQSPVDIVTKQAISAPNLDTLTRTYAATNATLINNGHDVSMTFQGKVGSITVNGKVYNFEKLHWHLPSEHTINGQRFPIELHLVHKNDAGNLAVIAILYQFGAPDSFYFQLKNKLAELAKEKDSCNLEEEVSQVPAGVIHMRSLQKRTGSYFRYEGSLATPPCTENVVWNVLGKVRQISKEQVALIETLLPAKHTARPAQQLNGRVIQFYNPPNSTISFQM